MIKQFELENRPSNVVGKKIHAGYLCLLKIGKYHHRDFDEALFKRIVTGRTEEISLINLARAAEKMGFRSRITPVTYRQLIRNVKQPCIVQLEGNRFVILPKRKLFSSKKYITCLDTENGVIKYSVPDFLPMWLGDHPENGSDVCNILLLEPGLDFVRKKQGQDEKLSWKRVLLYFRKNRLQVVQVTISLFIASVLQIIFPLLIQSIVDVGISTKDLGYIGIVLVAQLALIFCRALIDFIRGRLLLHISTMVNLSIISDFWIKLTRLPLSYFEKNNAGDILQRINDNKQVQNFLTGPALTTLYSIFNFLVFAVVLIMYRLQLFLVFAAGIVIYVSWMFLFLKIRRKLNYRIFDTSARENNATLQLIQGMSEIRLQNMELPKRWEWENIQASIFGLNFKSLTVDQIQQGGVILINQGKDIVLIFVMAKLVISGDLTLGALLALQYIVGQLSWPIEHFIGMVPVVQDAKISMERLNQIHAMQEEESPTAEYKVDIPPYSDIVIDHLTFSYRDEGQDAVLENISLTIPYGKTTAIVGSSGSGKTTLVKLLLKFYDNYKGDIHIGNTNIHEISPSVWRQACGTVLQDGFIFNDTVLRNIATEFDKVDQARLISACMIANILSFIESLPEGFDTLLGTDGVGISQGQRQRLLIARAVYKDPRFLFFDESTNALDSSNERKIVENLNEFFQDRTVVVVAHRLSTIRNADKIVVLHKGRIAEEGCHQELIIAKGRYYELVKNQLEVEC